MPTTLESLLDPISRAEFREQYYGKQPLLIKGPAQKFAGLFTWDGLNRLLNASPYQHPHVEVVTNGKRRQAPTSSSIIEQCRAGSALVVHQLELCDPNIAELVRGLEAETGEPMSVALVLSQPAQAAFDRHYDPYDVFVLQIYGDKAWQVFGRTLDKPVSPFAENRDRAPDHPLLEPELTPGDLLYLPRGHWHQALAQRGASLHLVMSFRSRTGIDVLKWMTEALQDDIRFRHELPLSFADEAAELREERVRKHLRGLAERLDAHLRDERTIQSYITHCVVSQRDVRRFKFPDQLFEDPGTQLEVRQFSRPERQRFVLNESPIEDHLTLSVWGHVFQFPKTARPLIEFIVSHTAFAYEDALAHAGDLTDEGVREVLDLLLSEGIVDAARGA